MHPEIAAQAADAYRAEAELAAREERAVRKAVRERRRQERERGRGPHAAGRRTPAV
ncbi:hypothetical protein GCM10007079_12220 [Nocardiopsis terrae]|uniref:Uncharacterized protein n=1 Tax=Nocardiopsis terrae TaxID=372655 RepID=A0ABR9HC22_9ACTN|nr:hypothetical protein [Nocardiopsis terrae]MBE1456568.1 hypothetical protein [Nocardiopsis terrae]GHC76160.1 hypothetical protein GCM10007079_12220 [Nocardiopsis terrae]